MADFVKKGKVFFLNIIVAIIIFFGVPLIAIEVGNINSSATFIWSGFIFIVAVLTLYKKIPKLNRFLGSIFLLGSLFGFVFGYEALEAEKERALVEFKENQPEKYLSKVLKEEGEERWLIELKEIFPARYVEEMVRREEIEKQKLAKIEEERLAEIKRLQEVVRKVPASNIEENLRIYRKLKKLDPENNDLYREKISYYKKKASEAKEIKLYPERFVKIEEMKWWKDGFGSIMMADFTIKNNLPGPVKDIEITCNHSAPSGTVIDFNTRIIYERLRQGRTRTFKEINMGFIDEQAVRTGCRVTDVVVLF